MCSPPLPLLCQDGCIVCPTTDSTFDLRTGEIKEWYPNNPVLRVLTPALRTLYVYPVKTDDQNIYISMGGSSYKDASAEIVFSGKAQPGITASDVNVEEVNSTFLHTSYTQNRYTETKKTFFNPRKLFPFLTNQKGILDKSVYLGNLFL